MWALEGQKWPKYLEERIVATGSDNHLGKGDPGVLHNANL
jgi:hypothetical protein